jgi:hypothetical protein
MLQGQEYSGHHGISESSFHRSELRRYRTMESELSGKELRRLMPSWNRS